MFLFLPVSQTSEAFGEQKGAIVQGPAKFVLLDCTNLAGLILVATW